MTFLNTIPLIGAIVAGILGVLILSSKNQERSARVVLTIIVFLNAHNLFESYLFFNELSFPALGISYFHYHLIGAFFLLYTHKIFKLPIVHGFWTICLVIYSILRIIYLLFLDEDIVERPDDFPLQMLGFIIDYFISIILNIIPLVIAFISINQNKLAVKLNAHEQLNFNWLKSLIVLSIFTYLAILVSGVLSIVDDDQWLFYGKVETLFTSVFPLFIAFAAMRFPVFSVHGDFKDLPKSSEKYLKSSLTSDEGEMIWNEMEKILQEEQPYRKPEYRLNDLADRLDKSLHHVSQAINTKLGIGFSDYINKFRVEEAKRLLASKRSEQVTILAICYESGFNSKTAFYNTFKRFTGQTPSEYKRDQRNSN